MKNVLIVDDEKITLRALRTEFTEAGYNVTTATAFHRTPLLS